MVDSSVPTPEDVASIVALDSDPALRNLRITQGYHDLSEGMRARTGGVDMNWTTLGTWASKTAGRFIRNEEVPAAFRKLLHQHGLLGEITKRLGLSGLVGLVGGIIDDVSTNIMVGNRVVFEELAGCFAAFLAERSGDTERDDAALERFLERYSDGDPLPDQARWVDGVLVAEQQGGQAMLKDMCRALYAAIFESDPNTRAELLLLANGYGGLHEQTRLQTYIAGSLNAPVEDLLMRHAHEQLDSDTAKTLAEKLLRPLVKKIEEAWHDFATLAMMELYLPDGTLHLSRPIPIGGDAPPVPAALETIENEALRRVLDQYDALDLVIDKPLLERIEDRFRALFDLGYDKSERQDIEVGALDWVELDQRMHYILVLFRARAQDQRLFAQPFTAEQRDIIVAGRVPDGPL